MSTIRYLQTDVNSNYNALQMRFERRYSQGLTLVGSFNYQKTMGIGYEINSGGGFGPRLRRTRETATQTGVIGYSSTYALRAQQCLGATAGAWRLWFSRPYVGRVVTERNCDACLRAACDHRTAIPKILATLVARHGRTS